MAQLIIIRGNSGSGKTSAAKELQRRLGDHTMLISQDVIRRDILKTKDGPGTKALPLLAELLRYGSQNCEFVILEGILNAAWYADLFRLAMELFQENIHAYYYDLPFEETLHRHSTKPNYGSFGEEQMRTWWTEKDYLKHIPETQLTQEISLEKAVGIIEQNLRAAHLG